MYLLRTQTARSLIARYQRWCSPRFFQRIAPFIQPSDHIIDIGCGTAILTETVKEHCASLIPIDVTDTSVSEHITPILFDGKHIAFPGNSFDTSIIFVLHHAADPIALLKEAKRVSKRIIIIEDLITNPLHKYAILFFYGLLNWKWKGHSHSNRSDRQWKNLFRRLGLKVIKAEYFRSYGIMHHGLYVLEK